MTRRCRLRDAIAPEEGIPVEAALRAVTIDAAWQLFADERVGSLEVGKLADLTVVDRNPLEVEPASLDQTGVQETWLGGRRIES